jgi:uncharacterized membrane protein (UPF0136 family)
MGASSAREHKAQASRAQPSPASRHPPEIETWKPRSNQPVFPAMNTTVLWIYIVLLEVGGLIGFLKSKSQVSLIMSSVFAALLILTAVHGIFDASFARNLANILMAALLVIFAIRLAKTKKFMPAGLMLIVTIAALALRNIKF